MKVAFDVLPLQSGHRVRGVGTHTRELLAELKKIEGLEILEFTDIRKVKKVDLIHIPYFEIFKFSLPIYKKYPLVVTIHDLIPLLFPEHYPSGIKGRVNNYLQSLSLKNTKAIITISESAKEDISRLLKIGKDRIYVTPLAPSDKYRVIKDNNFLEKVKNKYKLPNHFALYIGNVNWNKNIVNMTQSCIDLGIDLVIVGSGFKNDLTNHHPELKSLRDFYERFGDNPKIHILDFLELEELVAVLNLAAVLLLVSNYEGFGLPILEAQACGTPVVTSITSSMPEVAGKGALLADPYDLNSIKTKITELIKNDAIRKETVKQGFENVKRFSWQKTAEQTYEVYKKVLLSK